MKEITFFNLENIEVLSFSSFNFKYIKEDPYIIEYKVHIQYEIFNIIQKQGVSLADFKGFVFDLKKMQEKQRKKFYFYPSLDDLFQIIFDLKDEDIIIVQVIIQSSTSVSELSIQYEMKISQIPELVEQFEYLLKKTEFIL